MRESLLASGSLWFFQTVEIPSPRPLHWAAHRGHQRMVRRSFAGMIASGLGPKISWCLRIEVIPRKMNNC